MSARISLLRDAVQDLLIWPHQPAAVLKAQAALAATAFVAPETFPFDVGTRSGAIVTLHGIRDGCLIGSWVDRDGLQLNDWCLDGTLFGTDDPDDFDLILPEDAPLGATAVAA
jgi:hypothetical protein